MSRTFCAALVLLLGAAGSGAAAKEAPAAAGDAGPPPSTGETPEVVPGREGRDWFALPAVFWLPETKVGVAGVAGIHFHMKGAEVPSSAFAVAAVAIEGQATLDLSSDLWLANGALLSGRFRIANYPEAFYGIGPDTTVNQREDVTRRFVEATVGDELPVPGSRERLRIGPRVQARVEEIVDATPGGLVATHQVEGSEGFSALGLGGSATWDSRDEKLWPTRGTFVQASYLYYPAAIGHNDGFGRGSAEARQFVLLDRGRVLGFAAMLEYSHGETPFSILAKIGNTRYLRGIREGRYRDNVAWAAQTELRVPIHGHFAGVAFAAVGDVAKDLRSFETGTIKGAGGAGLRYRLTREGATLRADVALAQGGPEVYVLLLEAF